MPNTVQQVPTHTHTHVGQSTVHTHRKAQFRSCSSSYSSSERMWMEPIKSVYSCLFMGVRLQPRSWSERHASSSPNAQQEGPVYILQSFFSHLPKISKNRASGVEIKNTIDVFNWRIRPCANLTPLLGSSVSAMTGLAVWVLPAKISGRLVIGFWGT